MTLERFFFLSLVFHILAFTAFSISFRRTVQLPPAYEITLVSPGGEGEKSEPAPPPPSGPKKEQAAMEAAPAPKPATKLTATPTPNKPVVGKMAVETEKTRDEDYEKIVQERILAMRAVADIEKKVKLKEAIQVSRSTVKPQNQPAPKVIAPAGTGNPGTADPNFLSAYASRVSQEIRRNWFYPDLKDGNLQAVVNVVILKDGTLIVKGFEKRSGNQLFDDSLMRALKKTARVDPPPYEIDTGMKFTP